MASLIDWLSQEVARNAKANQTSNAKQVESTEKIAARSEINDECKKQIDERISDGHVEVQHGRWLPRLSLPLRDHYDLYSVV
jgi:hypothetical protein